MSIIERALAKAKQEDRVAVEKAEGLAHRQEEAGRSMDLAGGGEARGHEAESGGGGDGAGAGRRAEGQRSGEPGLRAIESIQIQRLAAGVKTTN